MWMDKAKTILLNLLVIVSLVLSWLLINSQPNYDILYPAEYVEPKPIGDKKELKQLVNPGSIVLHYGDNRFMGTTTDSIYYRIMLREMEKWYFFNFTRVNLTEDRWNQVIHHKKAIEIIYSAKLPMEMMAEMFTFRGNTESLIDGAKRIIIYVDDSEKETYALFVDEDGKQMIQARTAVTPRDLDQFYLSLGNSLHEMMVFPIGKNPYQPLIYLPKSSLTMKKFRYFYEPIPPFQIFQTLFVDPSLTRQVTERDGTTIYTDGSKAVQIPSDRGSIHYYDPLTETMGSTRKQSNIHSVIQFINEHGGWNGSYTLDEVNNFSLPDEEVYLFRQYIGSYPIYGDGDLGEIELLSRQSIILEYHRSLINLDTFFDDEDIPIMTGEEFIEQLSQTGIPLDKIKEIVLGYQAEVNEHHLTLLPKWIIKGVDDELFILDATRVEKEGQDGLEKSQDDSNHSLPSAR